MAVERFRFSCVAPHIPGGGKLRARPFQIVRKIAEGGTAEVYEAVTRSAEGQPQTVAVKMLRPELEPDPEYLRMFLREGAVARALMHPNIVRTFDFQHGETGCWITMELVRGPCLRDFMRRCAGREGSFPTELACFIGIEACRGLQYVHTPQEGESGRLGIVHLDICPKNILLGRGGEVKISDFGIAQYLDAGVPVGPVVPFGRRGYSSPEQAEGKPTDRRSDIYSLSVVLFELLTGFDLSGARKRASAHGAGKEFVIPGPRRLRPSLPESLERILRRGLEKDPGSRYQSAADMACDLSDSGCPDLPEQICRKLGDSVRRLFR